MKDQDFNNLKPSEAYIGFNYCIDNSFRLHSAAEKVSKQSYFGIATSLLVLSAEEGIKALLLLLKMHFPDKKYKVEHIFKDHVKKHNLSRDIFDKWKHILISYDEMLKDLRKEFPSIKSFHRDVLKQKFDVKLKEKYLAEDKTVGKADRKWWNNANKLKNKGFYVDYTENEGWILPSITKAEYLKSRMFVINLVLPLVELQNNIEKFGKKRSQKIKIK